ncbi:ABC transporter permease [Acrocarpospora pleiomorpha]|uniref:ABC transporter permease n=1 Tax=Acrocarpospora pleiomorpha TaxID=90975 RepID=A0A5M3XCH2_9ACTN|nr:carbohydrate ABC transporter permease [Acrocarpospora pleiomorpha]GES18356.1 ABC transporter permease [Acrocarpospora pleiomorpha]
MTASPLRRQVGRMPLRLAITLLVVIEVAPLAWLLISSLKAEDEFSSSPVWSLPRGLHWQNYVDAWTTGNMSVYFRNSLLATLPALALIIVLSVAAGFALEIMRWRGRDGVLLLFLAGVMVPLQMVLLPLFTIYFQTNLINTLWSLIITYTVFGLPLSVFLMAGYYKAIPREILEAAAIDGAGIYRTFWSVVLPTVRNAIFTVALVQFFFIWNDLLLSLTFISDDNLRTVQTGLLNFVGQYGQREWGPTFASVCMAVFPTLAIYLVLNQKVMKGLTAGSVKG